MPFTLNLVPVANPSERRAIGGSTAGLAGTSLFNIPGITQSFRQAKSSSIPVN